MTGSFGSGDVITVMLGPGGGVREPVDPPVGPEIILRARAGDRSVVPLGARPFTRAAVPGRVGRRRRGAVPGFWRGQQGPVLSAAGASVTVLTTLRGNSTAIARSPIARDVTLRTVLGHAGSERVCYNISTSSSTPSPTSSALDLAPVWHECFRVLRPGGILMSGFMNPDIYLFDVTALEERDS